VLLGEVEPYRRAVRQSLGLGQQGNAGIGVEGLPLTVRPNP
jgi:hypothetical protein